MAIPITTAPFLEISIAFFVSFHRNGFCSNGFEAVSIVEMLGILWLKAKEDERARGGKKPRTREKEKLKKKPGDRDEERKRERERERERETKKQKKERKIYTVI
jgi:hypothetical protein